MHTNSTGLLRVASSPHIRARHTVQSIMLEVLVALLPAGAAGIYFFGWRALLVIAVSTASAVFWEALYQKIARKPATAGDLSAAVTGLLLAYNLPVGTPLWMVVVGSGIAIVLIKQIFGGIGQNFFNPALGARAILMISWVSRMSGTAYNMTVRGLDAVSSSTPLAAARAGADAVAAATTAATSAATQASTQVSYSLWQLFIGQIPGAIGEVSKFFLILGGIYLIARGIIAARIPLLMLSSFFAAMLIHTGSAADALYQLLSGGLILGAFFMATDYATSPVTPVGRTIFGLGCGLLSYVIRAYSPMPEGASYALLIMNLFVPMVDRFTAPRIYGEVKSRA